jgi:hypothetical protein
VQLLVPWSTFRRWATPAQVSCCRQLGAEDLCAVLCCDVPWGHHAAVWSVTDRLLLLLLLLLPAAYTNPADHFMDLITVKNPVTSEPSCPPVSHTDLLPDPAELRAYYKHVQVGSRAGCIMLLCLWDVLCAGARVGCIRDWAS